MFRCYRYKHKTVRCYENLSYRLYSSLVSRLSLKPLVGHDMVDMNAMTAATFERLSKVYRLLTSRSRRFKYTTYDCHKIYQDNQLSLLQDLFKYPRINQDMLVFLFMNYSHSSSIRALVLNDLKQLLLMGKYEIVIQSLKKMDECDIVPKSMERFTHALSVKQNMFPDELKNTLANLIIINATNSGEHILASSFALEFKNSDIRMNHDTIRSLLRSLAIDTTIQHTYNSYTIIKLLNEFTLDIIPTVDMCEILVYLTEGKPNPFFANVLFNRIFQSSFLSGKKNLDLERFYEICNKLIERNLNFGDITRAIEMWNIAKRNLPNFVRQNGEVLCKIINSLLETGVIPAEKLLIECFDEGFLDNPDLRDTALSFFGTHPQHIDKFEALIKQIKPPLRRLTLSLLFESFLYQNNESGAERILQSIFNSKNGINHLEFNAIIKKLLRQGKVDQSIGMLESTDIQISKLGYVSVLEHFLESAQIEKRKSFLLVAASKFRKLDPSDECLGLLTKSIFNYISKNVSNRVSRSLYTNINRKISGNTIISSNPQNTLNIEQYHLSKDFESILTLKGSTGFECLKIICKYSIIDRDIATLKWSISELRFSGLLLKDILTDIYNQDAQFFHNVFRKEIYPTSVG